MVYLWLLTRLLKVANEKAMRWEVRARALARRLRELRRKRTGEGREGGAVPAAEARRARRRGEVAYGGPGRVDGRTVEVALVGSVTKRRGTAWDEEENAAQWWEGIARALASRLRELRTRTRESETKALKAVAGALGILPSPLPWAGRYPGPWKVQPNEGWWIVSTADGIGLMAVEDESLARAVAQLGGGAP